MEADVFFFFQCLFSFFSLCFFSSSPSLYSPESGWPAWCHGAAEDRSRLTRKKKKRGGDVGEKRENGRSAEETQESRERKEEARCEGGREESAKREKKSIVDFEERSTPPRRCLCLFSPPVFDPNPPIPILHTSLLSISSPARPGPSAPARQPRRSSAAPAASSDRGAAVPWRQRRRRPRRRRRASPLRPPRPWPRFSFDLPPSLFRLCLQ